MKGKTARAMQKCLSLLLAATMLLVVSGIPVSAGTTGQETNTQKTVPENPVHHCKKQSVTDDITEWSYVYFGSYPQSEVTGDALTAAITGVSYDSNGDAWVDGIKYRRISKGDTNNDEYFGDSDYRYFKWERIKWRVLQNDGSTLFVVADKGLDCKDYNDTYTSITWENCDLREWLNSKFYSMAFSSVEQDAIVKQTVVNEDNPDYGTEGGNDTTDNIFLLSIGEVTNSKYGFCGDDSTCSVSRQVQASDYAQAMGAYTYTSSNLLEGGYEGNCYWWLRSPGDGTDYAAVAGRQGNVYRSGHDVDYYTYACVPALHINLSSGLWSLENDTEWSYVYFGSYPQSEVTGEALTVAITGAFYDSKGDAWVDGIKYRRISKGDTNNDEYFGDSDYRYFKWERIKWRVLQNDGSTLFVVADKGLDSKNYNDTYISITWENCTIRKWLNQDFYSMAFSNAERGAIVKQSVMNEDNPVYGMEGGNDTLDNIFLLSIGEATNPEYGFCGDYNTRSASRRVQASDYAHAMGVWIHSSDTYAGNCWWWLRSPGYHTTIAASVDDYGHVRREGDFNGSYDACVPALHINLTSDLWSLTDDGSSGDGGNSGTDQSTTPSTNTGTSTNTNTTTTTTTTTKTSLAKAAITLSASTYSYDGKTKKPTIKSVKLNGKTLKSGTDYSVTYKNNTNIGTATVTITGKGNYTGTAAKTFKITAKKGSTFTVGSNKYKITSSSAVAFTGLKSSNTKKVTIPKTVKIGGKNFKVTSIAANALKSKKVTQVTVGNNVTTIGKNAFYKCTKLTKVTLGGAVTGIGDNAFYGCSNLKNITLPSKVTTIGKGAFINCKKLGTITIKSTKLKKVGKNAFKGIKSTAKIKVPAKKLSAYKKLLKGKGQGKKVTIIKQ